jgi:hypothetical protein
LVQGLMLAVPDFVQGCGSKRRIAKEPKTGRVEFT